ncbi:hypothetical protein GQX73_g9501 [Xylaria multiplex]|uniref:DUF1479 domain protein n=1 Tax=Xylaria multiplex TaxID=323545 RepID=A0A7C8MRY1_9PEZI|nr:hypothetical protein GQX73_g9501 [Xylaria multiplex]
MAARNNITPMLDSQEPIPLSSRFAKLKRNMIACREKDVAESFYRLLRALRKEADDIAARGPDVVPTIDYFDIHDGAKASAFRKALRRRGVAVIKHVVPTTVAHAWKEETLDYIADNPQTRGYPPHDPQLFDLYWSPSQVRARADSRLLDAQRFAMRTWHASDERALVSAEYPVAYADRLRVRLPDDTPLAGGAHVDNGSVERWEPDGYGASGTYSSVFSGRWEDYDPWDSSPRLRITTDLYNRSGSCSMFRMFQGILALSSIPAGSGALTVCPMLQLSTAYLLLRPFFTPRYKDPAKMLDGDMGFRPAGKKAELDFLHPNNWNLNVSQTSILHGAVPGYVQELSSALHPHLQLDRTMVSIPDLEPGDYVIWHPDAVHAVDTAWFAPPSPAAYSHSHYPFHISPPSSSLFSPISSSGGYTSLSSSSSPFAPLHAHTAPAYPPNAASDTTLLYIPACPLTQTNALYLSRQRRAFLLGLAAPDFFEAGGINGATGERDHTGRAGVQDVADAGGEEGLRSMGLTPWEPRRRGSGSGSGSGRSREPDKDAELLRLANGILFPDRFDAVLRKGGRR